MLEFKIEDEFNEDYFIECFTPSLPYIKSHLNWEDYGLSDAEGEHGIRMSYKLAFLDLDQIVFSVKKDGRIMGYFLGIIDEELESLLLHLVLYNDDENGSRSWVYTDFYGSEGLKDILAELSLDRWHLMAYADGSDQTSQISGVADGEATGPYGDKTRNSRLFKSPYGWEEE